MSNSLRLLVRYAVALLLAGLLLAPLSAAGLARSACTLPTSSAPVDLALEPVASGFELPLHITHAGDGSDRLFVVEKAGLIRVIEKGRVQPKPFLDIQDKLATDVEMGLLGLAFHPAYASNGRLFVFYSEKGTGTSVVAEYRVDPNDPARVAPVERRILVIPQPDTAVHRAGQLSFGPDGYLYVALGNGGPAENSQAKDNLLGSILRLDIDGGDPYTVPADNPFVGDSEMLPEVWAYGFRNPWRFAVDACNGRLFVGDVGDAVREEINLVEPGGNYGFNYVEGDVCYVYPLEEDERIIELMKRVCRSGSFEKPIHTYSHLNEDPSGGNSVTGGLVYRGHATPQLVGQYVFADLVSGRFWTLTQNAGSQVPGWQVHEALATELAPVAFGEDELGELYVVHYGDKQKGAVYRVIAK